MPAFGSFFSATQAAAATAMTLGPELVTNGGFATDTDWTKGAGVTIAGGKATLVSSAVLGLYQNIGMAAGKQYFVSLNVTDYTSGNLECWPGGTPPGDKVQISAGTGVKTFIFDTVGDAPNGNLIFGDLDGLNAYSLSIDNVSVKEIL